MYISEYRRMPIFGPAEVIRAQNFFLAFGSA
jgi:hypothetical protein